MVELIFFALTGQGVRVMNIRYQCMMKVLVILRARSTPEITMDTKLIANLGQTTVVLFMEVKAPV